MPYVSDQLGRPFGKIQVGEKRTLAFETKDDIPAGDAPLSIVWTCSVYSNDVDANAASYIKSWSIVGTQVLVSFQAGGPGGITYEIKVTGTTVGGEIFILWSTIKVLADGQM